MHLADERRGNESNDRKLNVQKSNAGKNIAMSRSLMATDDPSNLGEIIDQTSAPD